jgi:hypothetical protein
LINDFSDKDKFYAVYNFQARNGNRGLVAMSSPRIWVASATSDQPHTLPSYTRIFSNTFVNEAREASTINTSTVAQI